MQVPFPIGTIHFIGIGGIGMSGIAEILHRQGFHVRGSDISDGANVERLRELGIEVCIGQHADSICDVRVVVVSSAIKDDNPELRAARAMGLPVVRRAEMLAELMRLKWCVTIAGSHGKTTTTSMLAHLLDRAGFDPLVINGGIINSYNSTIRLGDGDWVVAEADESDGSFLKLPATIAVVTNIDPEHMEHYGDFDNLRAAFLRFIEKVPFYGFAVMCLDHSEVQGMLSGMQDRRVITYGFSSQAVVRASNVRRGKDGVLFDVLIDDGISEACFLGDLSLQMFGEHNILNALAAIGVGYGLRLDASCLRSSLADFAGVKRRFSLVDEVCGLQIIDDYAHHPVEIRAVLEGAHQALGDGGRIMAVVQPHRYSRLRDLFDEFSCCFNLADYVVVSCVYAAGELPIAGYDSASLVASMRASGHARVEFLEDVDDLPLLVSRWGEDGDMVLFLGAGTVTQWAHALPQQLRQIWGRE